MLKVLKKKRVCQAEGEKCGVYAGTKLGTDVPGAVWGGVKDLDDCCFFLDCHEIEVNVYVLCKLNKLHSVNGASSLIRH